MASPVDIAKARILEIGGSYFKLEYPERTTSLWSMPRLPQEGEPIDGFSTPDRILRELKAPRERQVRRDRRQHAALLAMASALLVARPVLYADAIRGHRCRDRSASARCAG